MSYALARWAGLLVAVLSAVSLVPVLSPLGPAQALTTFSPHGGQGSADDTDMCPSGTFLVGLSVRSGAVVDQMALVCAPVDPNTGATGLQTDVLPPRGGTGGNPSRATCLPGFIRSWFHAPNGSPGPTGPALHLRLCFHHEH
jgi:hypothetical protein